jgi:hypothetical protein
MENETAFSRALRMVRAAVEQSIGSDRRLLVTELSRMTGLSPTPVREALSRLIGENLLVEHRGDGYHTHRNDGREVAELYCLVRGFGRMALAVRETPRPVPILQGKTADDGQPDRPDRQLAYWLEMLAASSGNRLLLHETARLNRRMVGIRQAELLIIEGLPGMIEEIARLVHEDDISGQKSWLQEYFTRGIADAHRIAAWLSDR